MISPLLIALLATAADGPVQLAAPGFVGVGVDPARATFYTDHAAQQLGFHGVHVVTGTEIGQLLGLERQKQLLGCGEKSNECMTELANALGVEGLLLGQVARVGNAFQLDVKIISARDARSLAAYSARAATEEALLNQLDIGAGSMAEELGRKLGRKLSTPEPGATLSSRAWIPAVAGAAIALAGGAALIAAQSKDSQLRTGSFPSKDAATGAASDGKTFQTLGFVGLGVGTAGLLTGGAFYVFGGPSAQSGVAAGSSVQLNFGWAGVFP